VLEKHVGNQRFCKVFQETLSGTHDFVLSCVVMFKQHVGNQCFCPVLFSGYEYKALSETNALVNKFLFAHFFLNKTASVDHRLSETQF